MELRADDQIVGVREEDQSYAKETLGGKGCEVVGGQKILGIHWDLIHGCLTFNV